MYWLFFLRVKYLLLLEIKMIFNIIFVLAIILFVWLFVTQVILYKYLMNDSLLSNDVNSNKIEVSKNDKNIINSGLYMVGIFIIPIFCICPIIFGVKKFRNINDINTYDVVMFLGLFITAIFYALFYNSTVLVIPRIMDNGSRQELNVLHVYFSRVNNVLNLIIIPVIILFLLYCLLKQRIPYI
jgi:hypothetical protein